MAEFVGGQDRAQETEAEVLMKRTFIVLTG